MSTFTHLCRYINHQFTLPVSGIESHHRLQTDLGLNDIEVIEVIVFMELLYELTLPDEVLTPSLSVAKLCALIEQDSLKAEPGSAFQIYRNPQQVFARVVRRQMKVDKRGGNGKRQFSNRTGDPVVSLKPP